MFSRPFQLLLSPPGPYSHSTEPGVSTSVPPQPGLQDLPCHVSVHSPESELDIQTLHGVCS